MKERLLHEDAGEKTWVLILEQGDEAMAVLAAFARTHRLDAARITGIGAFQRAVLGYFDWERKDYRRIPVDRQVEVVSFIGDIAAGEGGPQVHVHAVLGDPDGRALGGHLLEGHVRPTLELMLTETPAHLRRCHDAASGLALIRP